MATDNAEYLRAEAGNGLCAYSKNEKKFMSTENPNIDREEQRRKAEAEEQKEKFKEGSHTRSANKTYKDEEARLRKLRKEQTPNIPKDKEKAQDVDEQKPEKG